MTSIKHPTFTQFTIHPLSAQLQKDTWIGAEVRLNSDPASSSLINPSTFSPLDIDVLRQALYEHSVLVIRKQSGIDPMVLEKLASIWDPDMINVHSAGKDQVRDPRSILSRNNGARLPEAPNVQVIGNGIFEGYEGIDKLNLVHVVRVVSCNEL
jgi:alpha-ketoglutarate-dependent taurine dioxygenase